MLRIGESVDRYVIESLLGQGGMAAVYRARHTALDSQHAIKVLFITAPEIRTRLMREGKVQANLRHPNIVAVTDVLEIQGAPALVMEYVDGPPLDQWLELNRPTLEEALFLFRGILRGVMAAHERGVIHRDLKPANVLLSVTREGVVPKVADFGLTKSLRNNKGSTQTGMAMGTPEYMAPEQIRDASDVDQRVDMFALGCMLFELTCGQRAFDGPDNVAIFNAIVGGTYPEPRTLRPDLPRNVHMAIRWLLESDPEQRLNSCNELFDLLYEDAPTMGLNVEAPEAEPISISMMMSSLPVPTMHSPSLPPGQMGIKTQPPPSRRRITPAGAPRVAQAPVGDEPSLVGTAPSTTSFVRLVLPLLLVALFSGGVGYFFRDMDRNGNRPEPAPIQTFPLPTDAPKPGPVLVIEPPTPEPSIPQEPEPTQAPAPGTVELPKPVVQPVPVQQITGGEVIISGDARTVILKGGGKTHVVPGNVPAGNYEIFADFGDGVVGAGKATVREGRVLELGCENFFFQCRPK